MSDIPSNKQTLYMRGYFAFGRIPFNKSMRAEQMFESESQTEMVKALQMWTEVQGLALVTGSSGVGKSIAQRHFSRRLDERRILPIVLSYVPTTVCGFLRSLSRVLGLPMRRHVADLFDGAQQHLVRYQDEHGPHPLLVVDDAEGLPVSVLDVIRRLTCHDMDAADRFSILLTGTDDLLRTIRHHELEPLRSRISYAHRLFPFSLADTVRYVQFHLARVHGDKGLFTDDAIKKLFHASRGHARHINQLATQALIQCAIAGKDRIDGAFMARVINAHPLYHAPEDLP